MLSSTRRTKQCRLCLSVRRTAPKHWFILPPALEGSGCDDDDYDGDDGDDGDMVVVTMTMVLDEMTVMLALVTMG